MGRSWAALWAALSRSWAALGYSWAALGAPSILLTHYLFQTCDFHDIFLKPTKNHFWYSRPLLGCSWPFLSPLPPPPASDQNEVILLPPPFSHRELTSTSLNLTHLNSTHLISFLAPPRGPFWSLLPPQIDPKSAQV